MLITLIETTLCSRFYDTCLQFATIDRHDVYRDFTRVYNSSDMRLDIKVIWFVCKHFEGEINIYNICTRVSIL